MAQDAAGSAGVTKFDLSVKTFMIEVVSVRASLTDDHVRVTSRRGLDLAWTNI